MMLVEKYSMEKTGEVYCILCKVTNKRYIGQAVSYISGRSHGTEGRWNKHILEAKRGEQRCRALNNAIRKYGEHNFTVKTLLICPERMLDYYEAKFIRQNNSICPNGYNIRSGGSRGRHNQETIEKLRIAKSGEGNHMWGKHHSDEAKAKIGKSNSGRERDKNWRQKISATKADRRCEKNRGLPMNIYTFDHKNARGYYIVIRNHPKVGTFKKMFTKPEFTMEEKLQQAIDFIKSLNSAQDVLQTPKQKIVVKLKSGA